MVKMILLINALIIILVLVHALVPKNHNIQDAGHVITMILCRGFMDAISDAARSVFMH
jgi:hypothetical protein